jgi:hypothetical protein
VLPGVRPHLRHRFFVAEKFEVEPDGGEGRSQVVDDLPDQVGVNDSRRAGPISIRFQRAFRVNHVMILTSFASPRIAEYRCNARLPPLTEKSRGTGDYYFPDTMDVGAP